MWIAYSPLCMVINALLKLPNPSDKGNRSVETICTVRLALDGHCTEVENGKLLHSKQYCLSDPMYKL